MRMRLPNGNTATTEAENSSVPGPHFDKVFCVDIPVHWSGLDEVRQRDAMQEIDQPISWDEIKAAEKN